MLTTSPDSHAQTQSLDHIGRQLSVLEQNFPAWHVRRRPHGMWSAVRVCPLTDVQIKTRQHRYIVQPSMEALAAILAHQLHIAQRTRG